MGSNDDMGPGGYLVALLICLGLLVLLKACDTSNENPIEPSVTVLTGANLPDYANGVRRGQEDFLSEEGYDPRATLEVSGTYYHHARQFIYLEELETYHQELAEAEASAEAVYVFVDAGPEYRVHNGVHVYLPSSVDQEGVDAAYRGARLAFATNERMFVIVIDLGGTVYPNRQAIKNYLQYWVDDNPDRVIHDLQINIQGDAHYTDPEIVELIIWSCSTAEIETGGCPFVFNPTAAPVTNE